MRTNWKLYFLTWGVGRESGIGRGVMPAVDWFLLGSLDLAQPLRLLGGTSCLFGVAFVAGLCDVVR